MHIRDITGGERSDTEIHHRNNEKKAAKLLSKQKRLTIRYLKHHRKDIKKFAELLYQKGEVTLYDLDTIKNNIDYKPISSFILPKKELTFAKKKDYEE